MSKPVKLKPLECPFCGCKPELNDHRIYPETVDFAGVLCRGPDCQIRPGAWGFSDEEAAIKAWNTRPKAKERG